MKKYTHAWLAHMAIKRLEKCIMPSEYTNYTASLVKWFKNHRDFVVQGAWYPDSIIRDNATGHILKYEPVDEGDQRFKKLPTDYFLLNRGKESELFGKPYKVTGGNLPDRCEAIAHSIVDNLKMQHCEEKGSPISPTNNHIAMLFFMLSHYVADAHMPFHCDSRPISDNLHSKIEDEWENAIALGYSIHKSNNRFYYDPECYPLVKSSNELVDWIEQQIINRPFSCTYGMKNNNTWDFISAITQYSYLTAYVLIPKSFDANVLTWDNFKNMDTVNPFINYSKGLLIDAIDSVSKIWFRVWKRYQEWKTN